MEMPREIKERIFTAADSLFEQAGREAFPTVDAVRRTARVNMNDAVAAMREWRRIQTKKTAPVAVQVPSTVQEALGIAGVTIWDQAQQLANESLDAANAAWEAERAEADALRLEIADAFETQAKELDQARAQIEQQQQTIKQVDQQLAQLAAAQESARTSQASLIESHKRADDLAAMLKLEREEAAAAREKAEKAIVEAATLSGKLEGLQSVGKNKK